MLKILTILDIWKTGLELLQKACKVTKPDKETNGHVIWNTRSWQRSEVVSIATKDNQPPKDKKTKTDCLMQTDHLGNTLCKFLLTLNICLSKMPYVAGVAQDQTVCPHSLIRELHIPLICKKGLHWLFSRQCNFQIKLRRCAGWSGATLSAHGIWHMLPSCGWRRV